MNKSYFQYTFLLAEGEERDLLLASLQQQDFDAFEETAEELITYNQEDVSENLRESFPALHFRTQTLEQKNWNEEWEKNFQPVQVEDFLNIRADFHTPLPGFEHEIIINPKMSFGTGHHATTCMMLQQMRHLNFNEKTVLDFGTGTGILSIMAKKLGASLVTAVDNDEWSISNAAENIALNNCSNIYLQLAGKPAGNNYDIILANINKNVIIEHLAELAVAIKKGGILLLSGLLEEDEAEISAALNLQHFGNKSIKKKNGWLCVLSVQAQPSL